MSGTSIGYTLGTMAPDTLADFSRGVNLTLKNPVRVSVYELASSQLSGASSLIRRLPSHRDYILVWLRISLCTVCAMLTCCLLFTILTVMVLGIGIGYHYCFVQNSVEAMAKAAKAAGALRSGPGIGRQGQSQNHVMRSVDRAMARGFAHRMSRREADSPLAVNNNNFTVNNITDGKNYTGLPSIAKTKPHLNITMLKVTN